MDIYMPEMNGLEATRRIKTAFPMTAIIGLSVDHEVETIKMMQAAGICAYLTKGSAGTMLCRTIEAAVPEEQ